MTTKRIVLIALMVAMLTGGKTAIAVIPNVEIVSLFFVVFTLCFGIRDTLIASFAFVLIEIFIWGFMLWWVILYLIYWPFLITVVGSVDYFVRAVIYRKHKVGTIAFDRQKKKDMARYYITAGIGVICTILFGVISTFIEVIFMDAIGTGRFWEFFYFRYLAGIWFFVVHVVSNSIILFSLVPILCTVAKRFRIVQKRATYTYVKLPLYGYFPKVQKKKCYYHN